MLRSLASGLAAALFLSAAHVAAAQAPTPEDLAAKARVAKEAMASGRFGAAASLYAEIVQALPNEAGMRMNLGMALSMAGRSREAVTQLQAALRLQPDLLPAALFLGASYVELGEPAKAVEPLKKFLSAQPGYGEARRLLAEAELSLDRCGAAVRDYRLYSDVAAEDPRAWYGLGRGYECVSQQAFDSLQAAAPDSPEILLLVAEGLVAKEQDKSAFALYREAIAKRPGLAEAHQALARIYERSGHAEWAQVERQKAESLPKPDCRAARLECDFRAGDFQKVVEAAAPLKTADGRYWTSRAAGELARAAFVRLAGLPPSPESSLVRVDVLEAQRRYLESKQELQRALATWPEDRRLRRKLATLHYIAHEYAEAQPLLEELLKQEPDSAELNLLLGETCLESKEVEKAIPALEKAVQADPKQVRARAVLGRAYLEDAQAARAVPHLEAALASDEDGSLHLQLARAYRETGRAELAAKTLQAFQELRRASEARAQADKEEFAITPP